jgi:hypothetical protein
VDVGLILRHFLKGDGALITLVGQGARCARAPQGPHVTLQSVGPLLA